MDEQPKMPAESAILRAVFPETAGDLNSAPVSATDSADAAPLAPAEAPAKRKRRKKAAPDDTEGSGAPPRVPRAMGYSLDDMNDEWGLVLMGSKAVVVHEQIDGPIEDRLRIISIDAFKAWFCNRFTETIAPDGEIKVVTWATRWMTSARRRQYKGIEFKPGRDAVATPGYLNLWRGFTVEPREGGSYKIFRDHMLNNVCEGDATLFLWVFGWFAHLMQRPRERIGTALVMRGKMGTGKTKVGEVMGGLISPHYFAVDDPRYVTGQFNAHMASCLLLQAEEAVWAGDKAAEGRLKGLITSKFQMIENKGIDPIRIDNFVRLMMTSNEDWVVPAGKDERRFCVLDIDPRCAQNTDYFREMDEELDQGGREALLHDLLTFDLSQVELRKIPRTDGLLEQKLRSLDSVDSWWFERLASGTTRRTGDYWETEVAVDVLFEDYLTVADKVGVRRKSEQTAVGMKLRKLVPGLKVVKRQWETTPGAQQYRRTRCYVLPDLEACREAFVAELGQAVDWGDSDE